MPRQIYTEAEGWIVDIIQKRFLDQACKFLFANPKSFPDSAPQTGSLSFLRKQEREDLLNLIGSVSLNSSVYSKCSNRVDKPKEYKIQQWSKSNGC
ncbi:hypothetical protein LEP1GSC038_3541 [Leptospira weilii str. 2006001855]|uniref:Uncharacterized protein n=1 Tax=Leptospira weilii str. 2006001855 TaxID=996804 RepID=M6FJB9_9LEPT|nr:hypothetical protein LEP1GSC038_3541 [Leptospira weilii str. 2006001855]